MGKRGAVALATTRNLLARTTVDSRRLAALYDAAACRGSDPSQFDATSYSPAARTTIRHYCSPCPVQAECYELIGLSLGFTGIAGGTVWVGKGPAKRRGR